MRTAPPRKKLLLAATAVVLTRALPESDLRSGDVGAIVEVYEDAYELEFVTGAGKTQVLPAFLVACPTSRTTVNR